MPAEGAVGLARELAAQVERLARTGAAWLRLMFGPLVSIKDLSAAIASMMGYASVMVVAARCQYLATNTGLPIRNCGHDAEERSMSAKGGEKNKAKGSIT